MNDKTETLEPVTEARYRRHVKEVLYWEMILSLERGQIVPPGANEAIMAAAIAIGRDGRSVEIDVYAALHGDETPEAIQAALAKLHAEAE